jgi:hypothetical protein
VSSRSVSEVSFQQQVVPQTVTLGWTLRRAALGLGILLAAVVLGAWLMHASIEADATGAVVHGEYAVPSN